MAKTWTRPRRTSSHEDKVKFEQKNGRRSRKRSNSARVAMLIDEVSAERAKQHEKRAKRKKAPTPEVEIKSAARPTFADLRSHRG